MRPFVPIKSLTVSLGSRSYDVEIAPGLLDRAGDRIDKVLPRTNNLFVVTDSNVGPLYLDRLVKSLETTGFRVVTVTVPAGEASKSPETLAFLWESLLSQGLTRSDAVVALGGGVVGDLTGFAAATLLRGVDFIQIPTTLLAQVDSSVGGKVAVNLQAGKNLVGAFWQPRLVLMDPETLNTLPDKVFSDGMAEVIKYGCIWDRDFFDYLAARPSRAKIMEDIEYVLYTCCGIKRDIVQQDERDFGQRQLLNFGHTLGHAYELAGHYETWTHGQAVAAGMVTALRLGHLLGLPGGDELPRLLAAFDLPLTIPCDRETVELAVGRDKKGRGEDITLIVLESLGNGVTRTMSKEELFALLDQL